MKQVIIGASAAGLEAAKQIRELKAHDEILVISADTEVHSRCMLHHFLSGHKTKEAINFTEENFFSRHIIQGIWGRTVTSIDTEKNLLLLDGNEEISYDNLLIASGAKFVIPPINHFKEASNVFGFRDLSDAEKIDSYIQTGKTCVIVGSGLVGLDAAYGLAERGVKCTVVEMADRISPLQLDQKAAKSYQELFERAGCSFSLSDGVDNSMVNGSGQITSIVLKSGKELPCDFVVVAAGVRPNVDFLTGSGIAAERAILVDDSMRTNIKNVWAAGDVTGIAGIWSCAVKQGEVAAKNMCGEKTVYDDRFAFKNTMNFFGLTTLSLGQDIEEDGQQVIQRESRNQYEKYVLKDQVLTYVLIQGDISNKGFLQELIKKKVSLTSIKKPVFALTYGDFYTYDAETGRYEWSCN